MGQLKKLASQSAIYGISSILGKTINFLLIPLYTGYLAKEDLGSFTMIYALIAFLNVIFTFGMETTYFRFATGKGLPADRVYYNTQSLVGLIALTLGSSIYLLSGTLADLLNYPGKEHLFKWVALILTIDAFLAIPYAKLRMEGKALAFAMIKLLNIVLNVGLNLLFIVVAYHIYMEDWLPSLSPWISTVYQPEWGVDYILLANVIANALILPVIWYHSRPIKVRLERSILKPMWSYTYPLMFMGLAGVINEVFSRGLFEYAIPEGFYDGLSKREAGGVFGANFKLAIFMNLIIQAFKYAAEPFFFQQTANKDSPLVFAKVMHWFIIFCTFLMVVVSVNLDLIARLFFQSPGYETGLVMVPMLLLGYLFLGIYYNLSIWFKLTDRTSYSFYITAIGAVITIAIILTLVPVWGFMGGALSTLGSYFVMSVICYVIGQKYYRIPYNLKKGIWLLVISFGISYLGFWIDTGNSWINFVIHNSFVVLYGMILFLMEKKELTSLLSRKNQR
ncbi:MAG: polysaccharide biosynthesis C-terminal domain-containing protein [Lunatimonas sp.]|uniref:lipopolysaccharide biosynthesis protein n=1 Tax=Lunatimonas sp. TaxID=2060141 RepID=UPI00263AAB27|nr:polysaccharide biosynthesis C-terminal domain-containing protein [Lunatimonas sp.]MCC5938721.1 polysaccharide biosynthesis C-terminal domain-containing protein [Lunatimonas sp.]